MPLVGTDQTTEGEGDVPAVGAHGGELLVSCAQSTVRECDVLEADGGEVAVGVEGVPQSPVVGKLFPVAGGAWEIAPRGVLDGPEDTMLVAG